MSIKGDLIKVSYNHAIVRRKIAALTWSVLTLSKPVPIDIHQLDQLHENNTFLTIP